MCDFLHVSKYRALTSMTCITSTFVMLLMSVCWAILQKYMHFPYSSFIWSMLYIQGVLCIVHTGNTLLDIRKFNVNKLWNKWTFLLLFDSRSGNWIPRQHHHRHCLPYPQATLNAWSGDKMIMMMVMVMMMVRWWWRWWWWCLCQHHHRRSRPPINL